MAIKAGQLVKANDVVKKLTTSLYNLSAAAVDGYSSIFDATTTTINNIDSKSNFWYNVKLPKDPANGTAEILNNYILSNIQTKYFLDDLSANILSLDTLAGKFNTIAGKTTSLSGFRGLILSCYAATSNIRYTYFKYMVEGETFDKANNAFLSRRAIESLSTKASDPDDPVSITDTENMFYNKTAIPAASCSYQEILPYKSTFGDLEFEIRNNNYKLTGNSTNNFFTNFNSLTAVNVADTAILNTGKLMVAKDVQNCIRYMDRLTEHIRDTLTCEYGVFTDNSLTVFYVSPLSNDIKLNYDNSANIVSLSNDLFLSNGLTPEKFTLSSFSNVCNDSSHPLSGNYKLSDFFIGWTADLDKIKNNPYIKSSSLDTFWPKASADNVINLTKATEAQISNFNLKINKVVGGKTLSVCPVYDVSFDLSCYYGWWWGDFHVHSIMQYIRNSGWTSQYRPGFPTESSKHDNTYAVSHTIGGRTISIDFKKIVEDYSKSNPNISCVPHAFMRNDDSYWTIKDYDDNSTIKNFITDLNNYNKTQIQNLNSKGTSKYLSNFYGTVEIKTLSSYHNAIKGGNLFCGYILEWPNTGISARHNIQDGNDWGSRERYVCNYNGTYNADSSKDNEDCNLISVSTIDICQAHANDILESTYYYIAKQYSNDIWPQDFKDNPKSIHINPTLTLSGGQAKFDILFDVGGAIAAAGGLFADYWIRNPNSVVFWRDGGRHQYTGPHYPKNGINGDAYGDVWLTRRKNDVLTKKEHNFYPTFRMITLMYSNWTYEFITIAGHKRYAQWNSKLMEWGCHIEGLGFKFVDFNYS